MTCRLSIAIFLATVAVAAVPSPNQHEFTGPPPVTEHRATSTLVVLGHHCDPWGGVDSIAMVTDGEGPHLLRWNNEALCGRRS